MKIFDYLTWTIYIVVDKLADALLAVFERLENA